MVEVKIMRAGPASTIQDLGRFGSLNLGVCQTGAADPRLVQIANALVGNEANAACIEFSLLGPELKICNQPSLMSVAGDVEVKLNGKPVQNFTSFVCKPEDIVTVGALKTHAYAYLAVAGGFDTPLLYGSRSTHARAGMGGFEGRKLQDLDCLPIAAVDTLNRIPKILTKKHVEDLLKIPDQFEVVLGPQDDAFDEDQINKFLSSNYKVTLETDRMGMRLDGPVLKHLKGADILSDGIAPGSIQVPGSGLPIVLLAERQTIGGYTKIATVLSCRLGQLSQTLANTSIRFSPVSPEASIEITRTFHKAFTKILASIENSKADVEVERLLSQNLISGVVSGKEAVI